MSVTDVLCDVRTLAEERPSRIAAQLSRVSDVTPFISPKSRLAEFVLVASYGSQLSPNEREWSFPSTVTSIGCRYLERWLPTDATAQEFRLRNAYFHLLWHRDPEEAPQEIVAFHWEPGRVLAAGERRHLQRPHLHVAVAPEPLARSHFVVTLTVPDGTQAAIGYLDDLLDEALEVVSDEVLERVRARPLA